VTGFAPDIYPWWTHHCTHPKTVHAVNCGSFFLWRLPEHDMFCPTGYCTSPSGIQGPGAEDPNAIATQGTDCVGHYLECTALCEAQEDRPWVEVVPRTGYGLSCDAAIARPPGDCSPGDGGCGNTDACSLGGVLVDTTVGGGTIGFNYDQQCTDAPGWMGAVVGPRIGHATCTWLSTRPSSTCDNFNDGYQGNAPANEACCACKHRHPCAWHIECPGLESPRLTFTPPPPPEGRAPGYLPPGHTVTVSDGIDGVGGHTARLLASLDGNVGDGVWQATARAMTVAFTGNGEVEAGDGFSASWFCH
jgi:hypothetical protein